MKKKIGIVRFLGTNCERDVFLALKQMGFEASYLHSLNRYPIKDYKAFILPGGFSYGDYLRAGLLASKTPVMDSIRQAHKKDYPILGICNGFQILCESKLLPGCLLENKNLKFIDEFVSLKLVNSSFWGKKKKMSLPIAHAQGRYYADQKTLKTLEDQKMIWLKYEKDINGSLKNIAGLKKANLAALMPHPERAMHDWMGSNAGQSFFESLS